MDFKYFFRFFITRNCIVGYKGKGILQIHLYIFTESIQANSYQSSTKEVRTRMEIQTKIDIFSFSLASLQRFFFSSQCVWFLLSLRVGTI